MAQEAKEVSWVDEVRAQLQPKLAVLDAKGISVKVGSKKRLTYALEIDEYLDDELNQKNSKSRGYQTDLLIYDQTETGSWIPRLVIECKYGGISTHDILTYSAKAVTHKQIHPYLRYGILIGNHGKPLDIKVAWHGMYFDFAMVWTGEEATDSELNDFMDIVMQEVKSSRVLQTLIQDRSKKKNPYRFFHKPLKFKDYK